MSRIRHICFEYVTHLGPFKQLCMYNVWIVILVILLLSFNL